MRSKFAVFAALLLLARIAPATEPAHDDDVRATAPSEEAKGHSDTALEHYRPGHSNSAISAAIVGTIFGVRALVLQPGGNDATGRSTSIDTLRDRAARARDSARVADVAFAVSIVSGSAAALLYFGRSPDQRATTASVRL